MNYFLPQPKFCSGVGATNAFGDKTSMYVWDSSRIIMTQEVADHIEIGENPWRAAPDISTTQKAGNGTIAQEKILREKCVTGPL